MIEKAIWLVWLVRNTEVVALRDDDGDDGDGDDGDELSVFTYLDHLKSICLD